MENAVFLDCHGTLVVDHGYTYKVEDLKLRPNVIGGLQRLAQDFILVIITNQSGIARGHYTVEDFEQFNAALVARLKRQGIIVAQTYYCPHHPEGVNVYRQECLCRKPKNGLFQQAIQELDIIPEKSWAIGDSLRDVHPAKLLHCRTILLNKKKVQEESVDFIARDLTEAAAIIAQQKGEPCKS